MADGVFRKVLPPVVWACGPDGRCISLSQAWSSYTGEPVSVGLGWGFLDCVHSEDRPAILAAFEQASRSGTTYQVEYRLRSNDGTYRSVLDTAMPEFEAGTFKGLTGAIVDNTERRAAEERLRERERELRLVTDAVPVLISHVDKTGRYRFANAAYRDWYGVDPQSLVGRSIVELLGPERYRDRAQYIEAALAGQPVTYDGEITLANGDVRFVETSYVPNICTGGNIDGFIAVVNDITDRKTSMEQIQLVVGELKHHTANLLTMVQAIARRTLRSAVNSPEALEQFNSQIEALSAVTEAMAPQDVRQVSMAKLIDRILAPHQQPDNERQFVIDGRDVYLPGRLAIPFAMILHELATNATKYGALSVPTGTVEIRWNADDSRLSFSWRETGGPSVSKPKRSGFGTELFSRAIPGGDVTLDFRPDGFAMALQAQLA